MRPPRDPATGLPPVRGAWLAFVALSAVAFFAWSQAFAGLLGTRAWWEWLEPRLAARPEHALEAALFAIDPAPHHGTLVFGDAAFVDRVRTALGSEASLGIALETDRLDTVADFLEGIAALRFERVLVQDRASFWSSYEPMAAEQRLDHWRRHALGEPAPQDPPAPRVFWRSLTEWAAGPVPLETERWERVEGPPSLMNVSFAFPPPPQRGAARRLEALASRLGERLVWVVDTSGLPPDTPPALLREYRAALDDPRTLGRLGRHVAIESLRAGRGEGG